MKIYIKNKLQMASYILISLVGCGEKEIIQDVPASIPVDLISDIALGDSITVKQAREQNVPNKELIIEGFIGGRENPFAKGRAIFAFGDDALETCDEIPGDNCTTPWDACCESREKIISSILTIQIVDENNNVLNGTLMNVNGIKGGARLKIKGVVDANSKPEAMIFNAENIEFL